MDQDEVSRRLNRAMQKLIERDRDLFVRDVNERSITHRLAMYMQEEFPELTVDCEYNRNHDNVKKLVFYPRTVETNDTDAKTVFPDIVVHTRGTNEQNLLVLEAKKCSNRQNSDRKKLEAFRTDANLRYQHAVFVEFRTGDNDPGLETMEFVTSCV